MRGKRILIILVLILAIILVVVACGVEEPGYNFATDQDTFSSEGNILYVKVMGYNLYTFDLKDYDYSLMSEISLKVRNLQTGEMWRFPYYNIHYIRVIE